MKAVQEFQTLLQAGKDGEFSMEWIIAKEQVKHRLIVCFARLPVGIGHCNLIQICER